MANILGVAALLCLVIGQFQPLPLTQLPADRRKTVVQMIAYTLLVCVALTGQSTVCRPFGTIRFINKADCEHYRDDRGQRELHAQHLSGSSNHMKLVCTVHDFSK
jgi:hypothetical protein